MSPDQYFIWYVLNFAGVVSFHMVCREFSICLRISYSMSSVLFVSLVFIWCVESTQGVPTLHMVCVPL